MLNILNLEMWVANSYYHDHNNIEIFMNILWDFMGSRHFPYRHQSVKIYNLELLGIIRGLFCAH